MLGLGYVLHISLNANPTQSQGFVPGSRSRQIFSHIKNNKGPRGTNNRVQYPHCLLPQPTRIGTRMCVNKEINSSTTPLTLPTFSSDDSAPWPWNNIVEHSYEIDSLCRSRRNVPLSLSTSASTDNNNCNNNKNTGELVQKIIADSGQISKHKLDELNGRHIEEQILTKNSWRFELDVSQAEYLVTFLFALLLFILIVLLFLQYDGLKTVIMYQHNHFFNGNCVGVDTGNVQKKPRHLPGLRKKLI